MKQNEKVMTSQNLNLDSFKKCKWYKLLDESYLPIEGGYSEEKFEMTYLHFQIEYWNKDYTPI